jgi:geranylgeranyl diphosphate synthase type II
LIDFDAQYKEYTDAIEEMLDNFLSFGEPELPQKKLLEAMRYSLLGGGKRLRPVILLEFCRMCGGDWRKALPYACALEMVHVYSLIHDDLPCMDNDDMRRGKPACHIKYGEATALLAGSALLSHAFTVMPPSDAAQVIANASGFRGIAGGQYLDLHRDGGVPVEEIHILKTAAMFIAAAEAGCLVAETGIKPCKASFFGRSFGLAFQYADDYADGEADSKEKALEYYREALTDLKRFENTEFLEELIRRMMEKL